MAPCQAGRGRILLFISRLFVRVCKHDNDETSLPRGARLRRTQSSWPCLQKATIGPQSDSRKLCKRSNAMRFGFVLITVGVLRDNDSSMLCWTSVFSRTGPHKGSGGTCRYGKAAGFPADRMSAFFSIVKVNHFQATGAYMLFARTST